ncbi:MAG: 6-bladed beta-propeller, partial [bacterium]|nr:6-bladed beta-propeller [bacterium]
MKFTIAIILFIQMAFGLVFPGSGEKLELVKVIADDENQDEYFFAHIKDAALTSCKDIVILDSHAPAVSVYNWDGALVSRVNKKGKGPGDFLFPELVCISGDRLYIYDNFNN